MKSRDSDNTRQTNGNTPHKNKNKEAIKPQNNIK